MFLMVLGSTKCQMARFMKASSRKDPRRVEESFIFKEACMREALLEIGSKAKAFLS
jgi:hypothetical protein